MAKKMETERYYIETVIGDGLLDTRIKVSKKEFFKQFDNACATQYQQDAKYGDEFYLDLDTRIKDYEGHTITETRFGWGCSDIYFIKMVCKNGYHFTK